MSITPMNPFCASVMVRTEPNHHSVLVCVLSVAAVENVVALHERGTADKALFPGLNHAFHAFIILSNSSGGRVSMWSSFASDTKPSINTDISFVVYSLEPLSIM